MIPDSSLVHPTWIQGQQLALAATYFLACGDSNDKMTHELIARASAADIDWLSFPPAVLRTVRAALQRLAAPTTRAALAAIEGSLETLHATDERRQRLSILQSAQVAAHNFMNGKAPPLTTIRHVASLYPVSGVVKAKWWGARSDRGLLTRINTVINALRSPSTTTTQRLDAIAQLESLLCDVDLWPQIRNVLYQLTFTWPLLVVKYERQFSCSKEVRVGLSLPVGLDVSFGRSESEPRSSVPPGWNEPLRKAVDLAKELWQIGHSNYPSDFQELVHHTEVQFRFEWALEIANRLPLEESSAEAYFAQAVLAKLLGRSSTISSVTSGIIERFATVSRPIGEQINLPKHLTASKRLRLNQERHQLSWRGTWTGTKAKRNRLRLWQCDEDIEYRNAIKRLFLRRCRCRAQAPADLAAKLHTVLAHEFFDRAVFPDNARDRVAPFVEKAARFGMRTEILYAPTPAHTADIMQVQGWRRHRWVRCHDLLWGFAEQYNEFQRGLLPPTERGVEAALAHLPANHTSVVELSQTPQEVLSALWHLNYRIREHQLETRRVPPAFSWLVIRVTSGECSSGFWQILLTHLGASLTEIQNFLCSSTAFEAATQLAVLLNRFTPNEQHPAARAPDVLILIGTKHIDALRTDDETTNGWPLTLPAVLDALKLQPLTASACAGSLLGTARCLLVHADDNLQTADDPLVMERLRSASSKEIALLQVLRPFRWGFTLGMASTAVNALNYALREESQVGPEQLRLKLANLIESGVIRSGQGRFHLPDLVRMELDQLQQQCDDSDANRTRALQHFAVAIAHAPYLSTIGGRGIAMDIAFEPTMVREAQFHLQRTFDLTEGTGSRFAGGIKTDVSLLSHQLMLRSHLFAEMPDWSVLLRVVRGKDSPKHAWDMAQGLLEFHSERAKPCHPTQLTLAAEAATRYLVTVNDENERLALTTEIDNLYRTANEKCMTSAWAGGHEVLEPIIRSQWAWFLERHSPDSAIIAELNNWLWCFLDAGGDARAVWGEWFEIESDKTDSHVAAARICQRAVAGKVLYAQLWIKGIGAELCSGRSQQPLLDDLKAQTADEICGIFWKARPGLRTLRKGRCDPWVRHRWTAAARWLFTHEPDSNRFPAVEKEYRFLANS